MNTAFQEDPKIAQACAALKTLDLLGYDVRALRGQVVDKAEKDRAAVPPDAALAWCLPTEEPPIEEHFGKGKGTGSERVPTVLSCATLWPGRHYALTFGQRKWLRQRHDITPGATVTVSWVQVWHGSQALKSIRLSLDQHLTPDQKRGGVNAVVIENVWKFFSESLAIDEEEGKKRAALPHFRRAKMASAEGAAAAKPTKHKASPVPTMTLDELMTDLEGQLAKL